MKNIITIIVLGFGLTAISAQVGIETTEVRGDGLLDFPANATKGILLPKVDNTNNLADGANDGGAIAFNLAEGRIEYYSREGGVGAWVPMSEASEKTVANTEHSGTETYNENINGGGVSIEAGNVLEDTRTGVLKLSSDSKALILPQVADATQLPSPKPGTICYDMASDSIAVFNGTEWSFWN